jgi:energy-converting hydrogenase A subunit R
LQRIFVTDCEGPISRNDNAYELVAKFVPDGGKLFSIISKYDDVLADVLKREGYNAGDTLKLVLPFLKAYGVTDQQMREFSAQNLLLISGTKETLRHIAGLADAYIVSTSYEHYIHALCDFVSFPFENTFCTRLSLDNYHLTSLQTALLKAIGREIVDMSMINIPDDAETLGDFSAGDQDTIRRLDEFFWKEIPAIGAGRIFADVSAVGGEQKAEAVRAIVKKYNLPLSSVMYVGDSITDVQAFQLVRQSGGLAVSFNGNGYAIRSAEVSVMSENNVVTAVLADVFLNQGKEAAVQLVKNWNLHALKDSKASPVVLERLFDVFPAALPKVVTVTAKNMDALSKESSEFRKKVRGEAVGKLG